MIEWFEAQRAQIKFKVGVYFYAVKVKDEIHIKKIMYYDYGFKIGTESHSLNGKKLIGYVNESSKYLPILS